eukprot:scpid89297/ scgid15010/ 
MHIDEYEEEEKQEINKIMDGSVKKPSKDEVMIVSQATTTTQATFNTKPGSKALNPVKEGLSDTTLQILKACLKTMRDKHNKNIEDANVTDLKHSFIPTICVLEEMRNNMMVLEQINAILFGVTYEKTNDFFETPEYSELVE